MGEIEIQPIKVDEELLKKMEAFRASLIDEISRLSGIPSDAIIKPQRHTTIHREMMQERWRQAKKILGGSEDGRIR